MLVYCLLFTMQVVTIASMRPLSALRRLSPQSSALLIFIIIFLLAVNYLRSVPAPDPSSIFFDPAQAYEKRYSLHRIVEAEKFISEAQTERQGRASTDPTFCVGIATVQRDGARYFGTLMGSLLSGLCGLERSDMILMPFIANVDPQTHQAYHEPWLHNVADHVLTYENVPTEEKERLRSMQTPSGHKEKALFDYSYVLRACLDSNAPYILMLEDDVLAADGWFRRTKAALRSLEDEKVFDHSIYLRLFYNTRLHGWNSEFWPHYLFWSLIFELSMLGGLYLLCSSTSISLFFTPRTKFVTLCICTPACVALYFAAGRLTVQPFPLGVHRMDNFGCCSQAFVFPREQVPSLLDYLKKERTGLRDVLIERYADLNGLARWAQTPSVFQHIGSRSTKWRGPGSDVVDANGKLSTDRIWNYRFESWNADELQREREAGSGGCEP